MSAGVFAAIDLGGTKTAAMLADAEGAVLAERSIPTNSHEGAAAVLERAGRLVAELAAECGGRPQALGVGLPGLVDRAAGVSLFLPNLPGNWRGVPAAAGLSAALGCPVYLLNDVRLAALGEMTFGRAQGVSSFIFLALGTGIGGGAAVDGRLLLGTLGAAGEIGHQTLMPDGPLCGCGNRGCLEALASGPAVSAEGVRLALAGQAPHLLQLAGGDLARINPGLMSSAAERDPAVKIALQRAYEYVGIGVANAVTILHPELVVLGGGMAELGAPLLDVVRAVVRERVRMFPVDDLRIGLSALGARAGLLGGIALAACAGEIG